ELEGGLNHAWWKPANVPEARKLRLKVRIGPLAFGNHTIAGGIKLPRSRKCFGTEIEFLIVGRRGDRRLSDMLRLHLRLLALPPLRKLRLTLLQLPLKLAIFGRHFTQANFPPILLWRG